MQHKNQTALALLLALTATALPAAAQEYVCLETTQGDICLDLLPEVAPASVTNFLRYVNDGDYNQSLIHRSERDFVIQGGGYDGSLENLGMPIAADPPITNEFSRSNLRGTVAMARLSGNRNSATNQWFINTADNRGLDTIDGGFTVFAEVVQGMEIVDKIAALAIFDLRNSFQDNAFGQVPATAPAGSKNIRLAELVVVNRAYSTDVLPPDPNDLLPYQCSVTSPGDTLTEYCGSAVKFPVLVNGVLYEATINLIGATSTLIFAADRQTLIPLEDSGQERAVFANNRLTIPSVRVGDKVFVNVGMALTDFDTLEFKLDSFTLR